MFNGTKFQVHWEPSDKCNSRCPMCPRFTSDGYELKTLANTEWTLEGFINSWPEDFLNNNLKKILACGNYGDPCACREFVDIYEYVREISPTIGLACNTNGSLRTPDWWHRLGKVMRREHNLGNYCTFSIDGLADTNHLYRRKTDFNKIIENAKAFIDGGGVAHWDYIVFKHNEHQVQEAYQLAKEMGFRNFNVKRTTRWQRYDNNQGSYQVFENGKYLYDLQQPLDSVFKHNFEDATYFKNQDKQSITIDDFRNLQGHIQNDLRWVKDKWEQIPLNSLNIKCRSIAKVRDNINFNEIFISANGFVAPCCFLGSEPFQDQKERSADENYLKMLELDGGVDEFNIHKNNLWDILKKDTFQKFLPDTWDNERGNTSMRPYKCGQCCGVEWNGLDFGELGNKRNSYIGKDDSVK